MNEIEMFTVDAVRHGKFWVTSISQHGVYAHGPTLKATRHNTIQALALLDITADVILIPTTPELEAARAAKAAYDAALRTAVLALARRHVSFTEISAATGTPVRALRMLLSEPAAPAADSDPNEHAGQGQNGPQPIASPRGKDHSMIPTTSFGSWYNHTGSTTSPETTVEDYLTGGDPAWREAMRSAGAVDRIVAAYRDAVNDALAGTGIALCGDEFIGDVDADDVDIAGLIEQIDLSEIIDRHDIDA